MTRGTPASNGHRRGRILCVTPNFPRWPDDPVPQYTLHLPQDLQELGWEVHVLAPHAPGAARRERLGGVWVERFRYLWPESAQTVCYGSGTLVNLRKQRGDLLKVPPIVAAQWLAILRRLRTGRYDVLHSQWALPQAFTGALSARPLGVPHVVTCYGEEFFSLRGPLLRPFRRFGLHHADVVTAISSVTEQAVREAAPRVRDVRRIPMGVTTHVQPEASRVDRLRARHRRGDGPLLLFTGRHVDEKGVEDVLRAVALLVPRLPDVSAIIGGEGRDRPAFERLARELRLDGRVAFTGWAPGAELPSLFAAADVFVAPSRRAPTGWIEGQGIAPLEAMLHRTPVVATNLGGYADTVLHEQTGLVVAERSPHHIARAVERLVEEPLLAERLRERGHRMVVEHFSRRSVAERFASVFTALADRRRRHEEASPART